MSNLILSIIVVVLSAVVVVLAVKMKGKSESAESISRYEELEVKAMERAEKLTGEEKRRLVESYAEVTKDWKYSGITAKISMLNVLSVNVSGTRYDSVKDAVDLSDMSEESALMLMQMEKEFYILRRDRFAASTHYKTVVSPLFGTVYSYNASTIGIDTKTGRWADKAPRMALVIEQNEDKSVKGTDIYLADADIATADSYIHFDLRKKENVQRFEDLICKQDKEYGDEIEVIQTILGRIEKYNYLISKKLLKVEAGRFVFGIPTDDQLKEVKKFDTGEEESTEPNPNVINIFEFMHSSQE
jgi:hypothetical protein